MGNTYSAIGTCSKCSRPKIAVGSDVKCIICDNGEAKSGITSTAVDPGEDKLSQLLAAQGVAAARPIVNDRPVAVAPSPRPVSPVKAPVPGIPVNAAIQQILGNLRSLPMPTDLRQYKQISRAIKALETALEGK